MSKKTKRTKGNKKAQAPARDKNIITNDISLELKSQKSSHLKICKLILELKKSHFNKKDDLNRFYTYVDSQLGLAKRTTQQYLKVAKAVHLHKLNLDWTKISMLSKLSQKSFESFSKERNVEAFQSTPSREFEEKYIRPMVARGPIKEKTTQLVTNPDEKQILSELKMVLAHLIQLQTKSPALAIESRKVLKQLREAFITSKVSNTEASIPVLTGKEKEAA